MNLVDVMHS